MTATLPRVRVELLDPMPAVVVARVLDGLRAHGLDAELSGAAPGAGAWRATGAPCSESGHEPSRRVVLTTHDVARDDRDTAVVALPEAACTSGYDADFAGEVLDQVLAGLQRLPIVG